MLVDELGGLARALEDHDEAVEAGELATKLNTAREKQGDRDPLPAELVQKAILKVGGALVHRGSPPRHRRTTGRLSSQVPRPPPFRLPYSAEGRVERHGIRLGGPQLPEASRAAAGSRAHGEQVVELLGAIRHGVEANQNPLLPGGDAPPLVLGARV